jgi:NAD(P)-dependent dehydrogenase (short-subunit alcohol dehydrogenase family)
MTRTELETHERQRVALVTGVSQGIGEATYIEFGRRGWYPIGIATAASKSRLDALVEEHGGETHVCDLAEPDQIKAIAKDVTERYPRIDYLVNNAAMPLREIVWYSNYDNLLRLYKVNVLGAIMMTHALLPALRTAGNAKIGNVVSASAAVTQKDSAWYGGVKANLLGLSRSMTAQLAQEGEDITVSTFMFGSIDTPGHHLPPATSWKSRGKRWAVASDKETAARRIVDQYGTESGEIWEPDNRILKSISLLEAMFPTQIPQWIAGSKSAMHNLDQAPTSPDTRPDRKKVILGLMGATGLAVYLSSRSLNRNP